MEESNQLLQRAKKLKVLYAEDSLTIRKVTQKSLLKYFDHVDIAADGAEAIEKYKQFHEENLGYYDVIFTDLEMPVMSGDEFARLALEFNPHQEIVVVSSVNDFKYLIDIINIGVKRFIAKPLEEKKLSDIIVKVVSDIQKRKFEEQDKLEMLEYNEVLRKKEEESQRFIEAKVTELQEFTNALTQSSIVVKTDTKGNITYVNHYFCKVCGYDEEELIGKNMSIVKSGKRSSSFYKKLWNKINDKKTYKTVFENRHKDGSIYFVDTTISPILDTDGEIVEFIAVSHDVTQVMRSIEMAQKAEKSKDDFFINISHEMKTPLNSILGFGALLQKRCKEDDKSLMMANTIVSTGNDLKNLIESIVDMRKLQENTLELNEFHFNVKGEFEKYFDKYTLKANEKNIQLDFTYDRGLPERLIGDYVRIEQLISIFIDNALKFTADSGKVHVNIFYDNFDKKLIIEVKDNGIGIAKDEQKSIFKIGQLEGDRNRSYEGAGIGLSIASQLIRIMKGSINLKSVLGKGSLFTIELPLKGEEKLAC